MPRRQLPVPQVLQLPLGVLWAVVDATGGRGCEKAAGTPGAGRAAESSWPPECIH